MFTKNEAALERGWQASTARYQGLANNHAMSELSPAYIVMAARYKGIADEFAENKAALDRGWSVTAARYQGLAEHFETLDQ
jgi:hypothetical protein